MRCALRGEQGFNPWNIWGKMNGGAPKAGPGGVAGFTQSMLEETAEAMVARGLRDAGYIYLNLDCGWTSGHRDANGLQVNKTAFPSMEGLIEKVHSLGMRFGMYAGGLHSQCCNRALRGSNDSSYGHWEQDAAQFAAWKIDYMKSDPCGVHAKGGAIGRFNQKWVDAFTKLGYIDKLHFQGDLVCGYKAGASSKCLNHTAAQSNSWRTTGDIRNNFSYVMKNIQQNNGYARFGGP